MRRKIEEIANLALRPSSWRNIVSMATSPKRSYTAFRAPIHTPTAIDLERLDFDQIKNEDLDGIALFPEFYSRDRRTVFHGLLAQALKYRGVGSLFLFANENWVPAPRDVEGVKYNHRKTKRLIDLLGLPTVFASDITASVEAENVDKAEITDIVEKYSTFTVLNQFRVTEIDNDNPSHRLAFEHNTTLSRETWRVMEALDRKFDFDMLVTTHAKYVPRAIALEYAKRYGKRITATSDPVQGVSGKDLLISRGIGPNAHYIPDSAWESISSTSLRDQQRRQLREIMTGRFEGVKQTQFSDFNYMIELDENRETLSLFTHLPWESATVDDDSIFDDQYEWMIETVEWFDRSCDGELVIKVHPAERITGTNESAIDILNNHFDELPEGVKLLPPTTKVNPYSLVDVSDVVLVYSSTIGLESTYRGTPVITAADAHYVGKGFTYDPTDRSEYYDLLNSINTLKVDGQMTTTAERYLYNYCITRPTRLDTVRSEHSPIHSYIENLSDTRILEPGGNVVIDNLCSVITKDNDWCYTRDLERVIE